MVFRSGDNAIDLSALTAEELVALQRQITSELKRRDERPLQVGDKVRNKRKRWEGVVMAFTPNGNAKIRRYDKFAGPLYAYYNPAVLEKVTP